MMLGHIIVGVDGERYSLIKKKWLAKIFVTNDLICFFIQLGGTYALGYAFGHAVKVRNFRR